jgi:hypothetical protein
MGSDETRRDKVKLNLKRKGKERRDDGLNRSREGEQGRDLSLSSL